MRSSEEHKPLAYGASNLCRISTGNPGWHFEPKHTPAHMHTQTRLCTYTSKSYNTSASAPLSGPVAAPSSSLSACGFHRNRDGPMRALKETEPETLASDFYIIKMHCQPRPLQKTRERKILCGVSAIPAEISGCLRKTATQMLFVLLFIHL